jgi:PAS domain S-box-containing protein
MTTFRLSAASRATSVPARYGVALAAVAAGIVLRLVFEPIVHDRLPFLTLAAVIFAAWYGGRGPVLVAVGIGVVGVAFLALPPVSRFAVARVEYQFGPVLYPAAGLAAAALFESLRRAKRRAEQKQRELSEETARRRESEERLRIIADSSPIMVWVTDEAGRVKFVNQAYRDFFNVTEQSVYHLDWKPLVHPDDAPEYASTFFASLEARQPWVCEARVRRADGEWRWVQSRSRLRWSASGDFLGVVGSSPDITDRKRGEEHLRQAASEKDEFLAILSHELRNPLAPMFTALELLRRLDADRRTAHLREVVERQARHMARLIDDLLDVSRLNRGALHLRLAATDIRDALENAVETSRPVLEAGGHALVVDVTDGPLVISGDLTRLSQVFANLLNNAAKFSDAESTIRVQATREGGQVAVSVRDQGIGIASEHLVRIFDMFAQVDRTSERSQFGLGIGLTLAKRLVEMHGGTIEALSSGVGHGSEFVVRLPALPAAIPSTAARLALTNGSAVR